VEQPAEVSSTDETWLIERAGGQVPPSDEAVGLDVPPIREPGTDAPEDAVPSDDGAGGRADEPSPVIRGAVATPTGPLSFGDLAEGKEPAPEGTTRSGAVRPVPEHFPGVADADAAAGASADPLPASTSEDEDDLLPRTPPVKSPSAGAMAGAEDSLPEWPLVRATIQNDLGWAPARDDAASPTAKPIAKVGPARSDPPGVEAAEPSVGRRPAGASSVVSLFDLDLAELAARARASASASAKEPLAPTAEATGHESAVTTTGDTGDIAGLSAPPGESIPPVAVEPEGLDPESDEESDDTDPGKPAAKATAGLRRRVRPGRYPRGQLKERIGILRRVRAMLGVVVVTIILGVVAGGAIGVFLLLVAFAVRSAITSK